MCIAKLSNRLRFADSQIEPRCELLGQHQIA
jgi:hypothetical protein